MATDAFGITQFYPTKAGGREWISNWHNTAQRSYGHESSYDIPPNTAGINQDPGDNQILQLGAGKAAISTNKTTGICTWRQVDEGTGDIRMYMGLDYPQGGTFNPWEFATQGRQTWTNVEYTGYVRLWKVASGATATVCRLAARSNHFNIQFCNCDAKGYDFQFEIDTGSQYAMRTGKEIIHDVYSSPTNSTYYPNEPGYHTTIPSFSQFSNVQRVPMGKWIGMKLIVRNITSNGQVRIQGYRDMSDGRHGGHWDKMTEIDDNGIESSDPINDPGGASWGARSDSKADQLDCFWDGTTPRSSFSCTNTDYPCGNSTPHCIEDPTPYIDKYNPVITRPGYGCYYRTDGVARVEFKKFSIREIDPLP